MWSIVSPCATLLVDHPLIIPVFVKDPPLWSINIMNGTNMWFDDMYVNATAVNVPYGTNWVQNTDGFDTMDANNIKLTNMVYQASAARSANCMKKLY